MSIQTPLLQEPINALPLSNELKALLQSKGYQNLQSLLQQKLSYLRTTDGLTLHHELEIFDLLKKNGLEQLLREE